MILADYIASKLQIPFKWGENDCICFVAAWVAQTTGRDYLCEYPQWASQKEAELLLARIGDLPEMFDKLFRRLPHSFAKDGDLTVLDGTACLFSGAHIVSVGKTGLIFKNRMEATCAWSY